MASTVCRDCWRTRTRYPKALPDWRCALVWRIVTTAKTRVRRARKDSAKSSKTCFLASIKRSLAPITKARFGQTPSRQGPNRKCIPCLKPTSHQFDNLLMFFLSFRLSTHLPKNQKERKTPASVFLKAFLFISNLDKLVGSQCAVHGRGALKDRNR